MTQQAFNPTHEVRFNLGEGQISLGGSAARVLVSAEALAKLVRSVDSEVLSDFGHQLGSEIGLRIAGRLKSGLEEARPSDIVEHLGGDLALAGLGSLSIERWGRAIVMRISGSPLGGDGDALLGAVLEGALQRGLARDVTMVVIERSDGSVRFLATNPKAAASVKAWLGSGVDWAEALRRLHQ